MLEIERVGDNIDLIKLDGRSIYLIGTAHVSRSSADLAAECIRKVRPQTVAVELCQSRHTALKDPNRWRNTDIVKIIREGRAYLLLAQLMLAGFQKKLGKHLQVQPGAEMMAALAAADEVHALPVLADRDVRITLKRTWGAISLLSMGKLIYGMLAGLFCTKEIDESEIERLKSADALEELLRDFSEILPDVRRTLIDERDQYLAAKIKAACGNPGDIMVAVVGAGHVPGIKRQLENQIDLAALETLPQPGRFKRALAWLIPALVLGLILVGCFYGGASRSAEMAGMWFLVTGSAAALGAILALGHPLTVLSAFVASPFTTLHPLLASGWVAGLVEAILRKPTVEDLERMADDVSTLKGWWHNRVIRILLVVCLTNIFGSIGMLVGVERLAAFLR